MAYKYTTEQLFDLLDDLHLAMETSTRILSWTEKDEAKFQEIKRLVADYWSQYSRP